MPGVKRDAFRSFDLTCQCKVCGYKIPPNELQHIDDGINVRCPKCKGEFLYRALPWRLDGSSQAETKNASAGASFEASRSELFLVYYVGNRGQAIIGRSL